MHPTLSALLSIIFSVAAQFSLKHGMSGSTAQLYKLKPFTLQNFVTLLTQPSILGGFILYGLGALVWLSVLSKWDVSKAYPLVGLGFVFTAMVGALIGEQVSIQRFSGILMICLGVWVVART